MSTASLAKPGTLIRTRGREWVVLPESVDELLLARPVGGMDEEVVGILPGVEPVESATFPLPSRQHVGDCSSGRLLREAARLSTRAAAGPFRSFARIAVEPRPYQLVPLMMALKLDPVRLLIADDVGIGKTVEAALVARELLDRGEIRRMAVLCPPHLAEQWQKELSQKFHINAELVLSSTIQRLERDLPIGVSVFDRHRYTIVSTDFIKSERRAADFERRCPEFVIVDEAHGCTLAGGAGRGRQQRHDLVQQIAADRHRHVVLVTATPHSGNELAFRSLLGLLDEEFTTLPADIAKEERESVRRKLARHLVQRRRADIRQYLDTDTAFPTRLDKEETYTFSPNYKALFNEILGFVRDFVDVGAGDTRRRRVRYWSALALLRCVSSSPAAAAATLRSRAAVDSADPDELDEVGRQSVMDEVEGDAVATIDLSPGAESEGDSEGIRRKLLAFARRAESLQGEADSKLQGLAKELKVLLKDGFTPIVFCRFVDTAEYVCRELRGILPAKVRVEAVTGLLPAAERESRVETLAKDGGEYVLVCTDCLSEGVNLQHAFDAVIHYDLCWNPTRHEQREGRVDRFGQESPQVRVMTYYGRDNPIDGLILDVLIRKHKSIKSDLGVTVAVPGSSEQIAETLLHGALFRERASGNDQPLLFDLGADEKRLVREFHAAWEDVREKERASRSRFAQHALDREAVATELESVRASIGHSADVAEFFKSVLRAANVPFSERDGEVSVNIGTEAPRALRQALGRDEAFKGRFDPSVEDGVLYLGRTSPIIEGLAGWVIDQALDPVSRDAPPVASRCGVMATAAVTARTILVVARFRYHLHLSMANETVLCEEIVPLACTGPTNELRWLTPADSERLLAATPSRNLVRTAIDQQVVLLEGNLPTLQSSLETVATARAADQLAAHERVREATKSKGRITIEPVLPVDILGAYVLLPKL